MPEIQLYPVTESERLKKYIHETPDLVVFVSPKVFDITAHILKTTPGFQGDYAIDSVKGRIVLPLGVTGALRLEVSDQ